MWGPTVRGGRWRVWESERERDGLILGDGEHWSVSVSLIRKATNPETIPPSALFSQAPEIWDIIPLP